MTGSRSPVRARAPALETDMRLQIFSDLHMDVLPPRPITMAPDIDAVVVAGDTCEGAEHGFAFLRGIVPMQMPIIAVLGNHEHYRGVDAEELVAARKAAAV